MGADMSIRDSFSSSRTSAASALLSLAVAVAPGPALITSDRALLNRAPAGATALTGVTDTNGPTAPIDGSRALLNRSEVRFVPTTASGPLKDAPAVAGRRALLGKVAAGATSAGTGQVTETSRTLGCTMNFVALRMLTGDPAKYFALVSRLPSDFLLENQTSIFASAMGYRMCPVSSSFRRNAVWRGGARACSRRSSVPVRRSVADGKHLPNRVSNDGEPLSRRRRVTIAHTRLFSCARMPIQVLLSAVTRRSACPTCPSWTWIVLSAITTVARGSSSPVKVKWYLAFSPSEACGWKPRGSDCRNERTECCRRPVPTCLTHLFLKRFSRGPPRRSRRRHRRSPASPAGA